MTGFIKDRLTFNTVKTVQVTNYEAVLYSVENESSSFTVLKDDVDITDKEKWFIFNGNIWLIDTITPGETSTEISCCSPMYFFDRDLIYTAPSSGATIGSFVSSYVTSDWINQGDSQYQATYFSCTVTTTHEFVEPEEISSSDDAICFNLASYMEKLIEESKLVCKFDYDNTHLYFTLEDPSSVTTQNIFFSDGANTLESYTQGSVDVAKITVIKGDDHTISHWYLAEDGTIYQTTVPSGVTRAEGKWVILELSDDDDTQTEVEDEFRENTESHKVEWRSSRELGFTDKVKFNIDGDIISGRVSYIGIADDDPRYIYKSGDLAVTLTDKIRKLSD